MAPAAEIGVTCGNVTFKEGRTPALWRRALEAISEPEKVLTGPNGTRQSFQWATMLNHEGHRLHAIICHETVPQEKGRNAHVISRRWSSPANDLTPGDQALSSCRERVPRVTSNHDRMG